MLLVLTCNTLSSVSYMVRITEIPHIFTAKKVMAYAEVVVYLMVPLAMPARKLWAMLNEKWKRKEEHQEGDSKKTQ